MATNNKKTFVETVKPTDTTQNVKDYSELANNFNATVTQKVNAAKEKGKNTYTGYDKNGVLHYTTLGQDRMNAILDYYNNTENPAYSMGGVNYVITPQEEENPYEKQLAQLEEWKQNQIASINASTQAAIDQINAGRSTVESNYEDTMREAYIAQQKNKLANSDQLSAMGYNGGVAESTLADIDNTYQNNRLAGYKVRQNALSEIDNQVAEARNAGNSSLANLNDSYYDKYISLLDAKQQYDYQKEQSEYRKEQDAQEQANIDRQFTYDKQQDAQEQKNYEQEQKEARYAASLAGRYKTIDGAKAAIKAIQKSGENTWKIPYIYARIGEIREEQAEAAKKKVVSSSGSGNSSYSSKENSSGTTNEIQKAAKNYVAKNPKVATNSATVDTYLAKTNYNASEKEAFKYYMQQFGAPYITRG